MIKKINAAKLKPGMYIHDLNRVWIDHPFFASRFMVTSSKEIKNILEYGIRELYIDTDRGLDIKDAVAETEVKQIIHKEIEKGVDALNGPVKEIPLKEEITRAKEVYNEARKVITGIMEDVRLGKEIKSDKVRTVVQEITDSIFRNRDSLISLSMIRNKDEYLFFHSVGVCVLMVSFCRLNDVDRSAINDIGIGALLHDIGKVRTPPEILHKPGKLTYDEFEIMKRHVRDGYEMLIKNGSVPKIALQVVHEHHERYDGSGYPNGLKGEQISGCGQMAAIVDVYDAITSDRCYHQGILPTDALKKLFEWSDLQFNRDLVLKFIQCVGTYPVGTLVKLDDGNLAVVMEHGKGQSTTPRVKVVYNIKKNTSLRPYEIDLASPSNDRKILFVEKPSDWGINPYDYTDAAL